MSPDPIDLKLCPACRTGIPAAAPTCPECGEPQAPAGPAEGAGQDPFAAFGGMPVGGPQAGRMVMGSLARGLLGRNRGCLLTVLLLVFGPPVWIGASNYGALGALGGALLVVGGLGLLLTGWLVWLLRGAGPPR